MKGLESLICLDRMHPRLDDPESDGIHANTALGVLDGERLGRRVESALRQRGGHYAYYGIAGNIRALFKVYRAVERYWRKMLCSRSWAGRHLTWEAFNQIKERTPLSRPKLHLPYRALQTLAVL